MYFLIFFSKKMNFFFFFFFFFLENVYTYRIAIFLIYKGWSISTLELNVRLTVELHIHYFDSAHTTNSYKNKFLNLGKKQKKK